MRAGLVFIVFLSSTDAFLSHAKSCSYLSAKVKVIKEKECECESHRLENHNFSFIFTAAKIQSFSVFPNPGACFFHETGQFSFNIPYILPLVLQLIHFSAPAANASPRLLQSRLFPKGRLQMALHVFPVCAACFRKKWLMFFPEDAGLFRPRGGDGHKRSGRVGQNFRRTRTFS